VSLRVPSTRRTLIPGLLLALACHAAPAQPQAASSPASATTRSTPAALNLDTRWVALTMTQQRILEPLHEDWDQMDSARKGKWLEIAARFPRLPLEEQQRLRERMVEWSRMSPAQRQKARLGFQSATELRAEDKQAKLQAKWEAYRALSPEKRQELQDRAAEKAQSATPPSRPLGPLEGAAGPTLVLARPGVSTVLLNQRRPALPPASKLQRARPLRDATTALNPQTLLPRAAAASQPP
jgi:hypothetical protein